MVSGRAVDTGGKDGNCFVGAEMPDMTRFCRQTHVNEVSQAGVEGQTYISVLAETGGPVRRVLHLLAGPPPRGVELANDGIMHGALEFLPN